ncbi:MAG: TIM barrel protein [Planctomycetota bacterium]|nr:TIM barrel protein [Planctomycetota bacterium]
MNPLYFKELNACFDPNRARLNLGCGRQVSLVSGVETGQLVGSLKTLEAVASYATGCGARSLMISNYLLHGPGHGDNGRIVFREPAEIRQALADAGIVAPVISAHCAGYAHLSAHWGLEYADKFVPASVAAKGTQYVEDWSEEYILGLLETGTALGIHIFGWFWGLWGQPVLHSGYPWVFGWDDMLARGLERFRDKTARIRARANQLGAYLAHELHPGTGAICARDFGLLLMATDYDPSLCVWGDPSHCWAGESWTRRFTSPFVAPRVVGSHAKNFKYLEGASTLMISEDWSQRGHQFCGHGEGEVNLESYAKMLLAIGAGDRFCAIQGGDLMPIYSEAEDSILPLIAPAPHLLGACSAGIKWVNDHLAGMSLTTAVFTDGMASA